MSPAVLSPAPSSVGCLPQDLGAPGVCPRDGPRARQLDVFTGGELYAGLTADFLGRDPGVFRSMGTRSALRTEVDQRLLNGNSFLLPLHFPQQG